MDAQVPYFMTKKSWYFYDFITGRYELTDEAPEEARKSLEEYYAQDDDVDGDIDAWAKKNSKR